jgi:hypothetical protein
MTSQGFTAENFNDEDGNPASGYVDGTGFRIAWQNGPLFDAETGTRKEPTGAFVEDVIAAALQRIAYYQQGKFACEENRLAIEHLDTALEALHDRTRDREARGVEGTHIP